MEFVTIPTPQGEKRRFYHRGSDADKGVLKQLFEIQEYSFSRLRRGQELRDLEQSLDRPLIIDGGANIGASACWFAFTFPRCHIVAFEPDPANFDLLRRNTEGLDVELHQAALASRDGKARLIDPGEGEWGYRTAWADDGDLPMISMARTITEKTAAGFSPFLAKIDIEGGEADLFTPPTDWVDCFPLMIVELHDWLMPRQRTSRTFLECVTPRDRDFVYLGENVFSIRNS